MYVNSKKHFDLTMDTMKPRVSVIRIPRHTLKQIETEEIEEYPSPSDINLPEKRLSNRNEPILYASEEMLTRMKTNAFDLNTPRVSVGLQRILIKRKRAIEILGSEK